MIEYGLKEETESEEPIKVRWYSEDKREVQINYGTGLCWFVVTRDEANQIKEGLNSLLDCASPRTVAEIRAEIESQLDDYKDVVGGYLYLDSPRTLRELLDFIDGKDQPPPADCPTCQHGYEDDGEEE